MIRSDAPGDVTSTPWRASTLKSSSRGSSAATTARDASAVSSASGAPPFAFLTVSLNTPGSQNTSAHSKFIEAMASLQIWAASVRQGASNSSSVPSKSPTYGDASYSFLSTFISGSSRSSISSKSMPPFNNSSTSALSIHFLTSASVTSSLSPLTVVRRRRGAGVTYNAVAAAQSARRRCIVVELQCNASLHATAINEEKQRLSAN